LRTRKELEALLSLAHRPDMWHPPIVPTVATESKGIEDLAAAITTYFDYQKQEKGIVRKTAIARWRLTELVQDRLLSDLMNKNGSGELLEKLAADIAAKTIDPYSAVELLIK
jgi:LAO/AO transport system kinase